MKGLEAIRLMEQGKIVTDGREKWKIQDSEIVKAGVKSDNYYEVYKFEMSRDYEEYIEPKPLTGWERVPAEKIYYWIADSEVDCDEELGHDHIYDSANYFSTREKAQEIAFKQTLFRKLQRFSDENGGNEIDWNREGQNKYAIYYNLTKKQLQVKGNWFTRDFGQVYFISYEIAEKAIELFHDDLIKYFTHDWSGGNE